MTEVPHCCKPGCNDPATVEIMDQADPDPYTSTLHSCDVHIGEMLTHEPSLPDDAPNEWLVRFLEQAEEKV